jgi:SAM-dependent methyltransferase
MTSGDVARQIRQVYQQRPYPGSQSSIRRTGSYLAPLEWISAISEKIAQFPKRILVAGCGTGLEALALYKRFPEAEIVGIDFSPRSIAEALELQKRLLRRQSIRFFVGDLTNRRFMNALGREFDFISCHGVITYVPRPDRAVRNLARCLCSDGVLYLGVNGAAHFSRAWRRALPILGFDMRQLPSTRSLRRVLRLCDSVARFKIAQMPANYLGGDLFGPLIHNLPISKWIRICTHSGLHFTGDFSGYRNLRPVLNEGLLDVLFARSRADVHQFLATVAPCAFHRLIFSARAPQTPPWNKNHLFNWRPLLTPLFRVVAPRRRRSQLRLKSEPLNMLVELGTAGWEYELLKQSKGDRPLGEMLKKIPSGVSREKVRKQLFLFYQLAALNLYAPTARLEV